MPETPTSPSAAERTTAGTEVSTRTATSGEIILPGFDITVDAAALKAELSAVLTEKVVAPTVANMEAVGATMRTAFKEAGDALQAKQNEVVKDVRAEVKRVKDMAVDPAAQIKGRVFAETDSTDSTDSTATGSGRSRSGGSRRAAAETTT